MILFILSVILSLFSILGFGYLFKKFFFSFSQEISLGIIGFYGLVFITFISYTTHFILPHNFIHNSILHLSGLILFFYFLYKQNISLYKSYIFIFLLLLIGIFIAKSHDDFGYYHLPNALHFSQNKLEFGLGNLNHGFKQHSSIYYLHSIFYLPKIEFYLFNVINFFFLLFGVYYFYDCVNENISKQKISNISILNTLFLILVTSIFYRIGNYGADITGQILFLTTLSILVKNLINLDNIHENKNEILTILILFSYAITIKAYFILYIPIILVLFFSLNSKINFMKFFFFSKVFIFIGCFIAFFLVINISATGCLIYPVEQLCFPETFKWGLNKDTVLYLSNWYEIWAKAGAGPDFREENPLNYIQKLNWFENWLDKYFYNKVLEFLGFLFIGCALVSAIFFKQINFTKKIYNKKIIYLNMILLILLIIWFFNFPTLRYGGYFLLISITCLTFISFIKFKNNIINFKNKFIFLFSLSLLIFNLKNVERIYEEFNYVAVNYFKSFPYFYVNNVDYSINYIDNTKVFIVDGMCWSTPSPCLRNTNKKIQKIFTYRVYINK